MSTETQTKTVEFIATITAPNDAHLTREDYDSVREYVIDIGYPDETLDAFITTGKLVFTIEFEADTQFALGYAVCEREDEIRTELHSRGWLHAFSGLQPNQPLKLAAI